MDNVHSKKFQENLPTFPPAKRLFVTTQTTGPLWITQHLAQRALMPVLTRLVMPTNNALLHLSRILLQELLILAILDLAILLLDGDPLQLFVLLLLDCALLPHVLVALVKLPPKPVMILPIFAILQSVKLPIHAQLPRHSKLAQHFLLTPALPKTNANLQLETASQSLLRSAPTVLQDAHNHALPENVFKSILSVVFLLQLIPLVQRTASATLVKPRRVSQLESVLSFHSIVIKSLPPKEPVPKPLVFAIQSRDAKSSNLHQQTAQLNLHLANPSSLTPKNQDVARLSLKFVLDLILARLTLAILKQELA